MSPHPAGFAKICLALSLGLSALTIPGEACATSSRQLVEIADFSSPIVSPDGESVAFRIMRASVERNAYDTVWYIQRMDGTAPPRRVAGGGVPLRDSAGVPVPPDAIWSPDGRWIYYRALVDGQIDVWRAASDGSGAAPVTRDAADVRRFTLSADGQILNYSVGASRDEVVAAEQAEYDRGIRIDRSTPIGQTLFRSGYTQGRLATQRLGLMFNRVGLMDGVPDRWKAVDLSTLATRRLAESEIPTAQSTPHDLAARVSNVWKVARDPDSGRTAVLTRTAQRTANRRVELLMVPAGAGPVIHCGAEQCASKEISGIQWRPGSDEVLFTVTSYGAGFAQSIYRWNVKTGAVLPVVASRGLLAGEARWTPGTCGISAIALACVTATANRPPRLERIEVETGERRVLFDPNAALAQDLANLPVQLLRWRDRTGQLFTGQFYPARTSGDSRPPLFITYYRCLGFIRGGSGDEWPLATLADKGISTLCINAPSFSANAADRYGTGLSAVKSAIALLSSKHMIDRTRVGMGGLSFGAEVTMWTVIHSDLIAAASIASPTTSQQYYLLGSNIGDDFTSLLHHNWQLGSPAETPGQWKEISPASNLQRVRSPMLMQFPEQEYIHGLDYEIPLMLAHKADVYVFPNEPHNKFQPRHKLAVYERNLDWFRFWLQGYEDPDPAKAEQYRHWQEMRSATATTAEAARM